MKSLYVCEICGYSTDNPAFAVCPNCTAETVGTQPTANNKQMVGAEPKLKMCEVCGIYPADLPDKKCCGCNSYGEHF
jgi:rubrerythrin